MNSTPEKGGVVAYIDPVGDYSRVVSAFADDGPLVDAKIFLPSVGHQKRLAAQADKMGVDLSDRFLAYSTISLDYDDELYQYAMNVAENLFTVVQSCSTAHYKRFDAFLDERARWATVVTFHDRFVALMRPFLEFRKRMEEHAFDVVYHFSRPVKTWRAPLAVIEAFAPDAEVKSWTDHWSPAQIRLFVEKSLHARDIVPKQFAALPQFAETAYGRRNSIICSANMRDNQYKLTIMPILSKLLDNFPLVCLNYAKIDDFSFLKDFGLSNSKFGSSLAIYQKEATAGKQSLSENDRKFVANVARRVGIYVSRTESDYAVFAKPIDHYIAMYAMPVLDYIRKMVRAFDRNVKHASAVVVLPGRALEANILVACAAARKVPSIEIQSGTISPRRRFIPPLADEVLAIDPFSRSVYCDFLGLEEERVHICGGPKLDYDLSAVRELPQADARAQIALPDAAKDAEIIMLATQPIGVEYASEIAETAIKAIKRRGSAWLLIKPHPNEDAKYLESYAEIAKRHEFERIIIRSDAPVLSAVVASDIVMTYYSTVGLEGFALGRPILCINPFPGRPPFDLAQLGVATEVHEPDELRGSINAIFRGDRNALQIDPLLENVRDGKAIERVQDHILMRAAECKRRRGERFFWYWRKRVVDAVSRAARPYIKAAIKHTPRITRESA